MLCSRVVLKVIIIVLDTFFWIRIPSIVRHGAILALQVVNVCPNVSLYL